MKNNFPVWLLFVGIVLILTLGLITSGPAQALPEYSAQVGEPCSTCHISPSGGGPRGPRGQAWVGSEKPGFVPSLLESLEILGVNLDTDPAMYVASDEPVLPAEPLKVNDAAIQNLFEFLSAHQGN